MAIEFLNGLNQLLGIGEETLSLWHMAARALFVYIVGLILVRVGKKRFLGRFTAFDFILSVILGSVVSRTITGNAPFYPTLFAAFVLVAIHWMLSHVAFFSRGFGQLIKGTTDVLILDGEIQWDNMREANISQRDLEGALRTEMKTSSLENIKEARLERSGRISFITHDPKT